MPFQFVPDEDPVHTIKVPYLEEARSDIAPYYRSEIPIDRAQREFEDNMTRIGATVQAIMPGKFLATGTQVERYGYVVRFQMYQRPGVMRIAALPIRSETKQRIMVARRQALLNLRDWVKAAITAQVFAPDSVPFMPFMLIDETRTIGDLMREQGYLALPIPNLE
jgi:hypothetical protein